MSWLLFIVQGHLYSLSATHGAALGRLGDAREDLEQRALAGAVAADDADDLAALDFEGDVTEGPEIFGTFQRLNV